MRIGKLAEISACQTVTVRFYEKEGLLKKPARTHNNYRIYSKEDLGRLKFILHCRKHGIKLDDIRKLLAFRDDSSNDCVAIGDMLDAYVQSVEQQISSLIQLKKGLLHLRGKCSDKHNACECTIIQNLEDTSRCCA